jgi:hypothetical protein
MLMLCIHAVCHSQMTRLRSSFDFAARDTKGRLNPPTIRENNSLPTSRRVEHLINLGALVLTNLLDVRLNWGGQRCTEESLALEQLCGIAVTYSSDVAGANLESLSRPLIDGCRIMLIPINSWGVAAARLTALGERGISVQA